MKLLPYADMGTVALIALVALIAAMPRLTLWLQARGVSRRYVRPVVVILFAMASWLTYRDFIAAK
jgi:hypothetical protein